MSACSPMSFQGITPEIFQKIQKELEGKGFVLPGNQGTVKGPFGIIIEYKWDSESMSLTTQVTDKSFLVSCKQIQDQLESAIQKFIS
jgi:hypothetical protein